MKSNFALSMSFDGLRLMHRVPGGWHMVGQVALDDADMTGALARLKDAADVLEPNGIATKLLVPNDQIKYIALDGTRAQDEDVREALHGATPYSVDELAYDFAKGGGRTYVAAVAHETLDEAKQFASEHGFNPVSFAAIPEPFTYVGEAFFGATDGNDATRDAEPVIVIGDAGVDLPTSPAAAEHPQPATSEPENEDAPEAIPAPIPAPVDAEPEVEDVENTDVEPDPTPEAEPDTTPIEDTTPDSAPVDTVEVDEVEADIQPEPHPEPEAAPIADVPPEAVPEPEAELEPEPDVAPAPMFASRLRADRSEGAPAAAPESDSTRAEPTFSRPAASLAVPTGTGTDAMPPLSAPSRDANATPAAKITIDKMEINAADTDVAPPVTGDAPTALSPDAAVAAASLTIDPDPVDDAPAQVEGKSAAATALGAASAVGGAVGGMFASRRMARADAKADAKDVADTATADDKSRRTVFGARKQPKPKAVVGGKPRFLGLILTAILLLFLLAFAAFAALSEDGIASWFGFGKDDTQIATPIDPDAADPAPNSAASEVAAATPTDTAQTAPAPDALAAPLTAPSGGQVLSPEDATRIYAATGVWQRAPRIPLTPRTSDIDTLALGAGPTSVMRVPTRPLASASSVAGDAVIATPIDPPAPDATFNFGADGLIVASEQGNLTPDGILIIAGAPPLNPPTRPGTIAPVVTPQDQLAAVVPDTAQTLPDAPDGVIIISGRPVIEPPVRTGTTAPAPASAPETAALATGTPPLVSTDGLLVLAGSPPILPPARPGTVAVAVTPVVPEPTVDPAQNPGEILPELGTGSPEGLNIIAGSPPILPPVRPGTLAPQANTSVADLTSDVTAALAIDPTQLVDPTQIPTANTRRPLVRPAAVIQAAAAAANAPILGDLTTSQALAFRPRTRPAGLAPAPVPVPDPEPQDAAVVETPAPTGLQIAPEIAAAVQAAANRPNPIVNPTALAVPVSSRPDPRPRNMDRIVARAQQAAARAPAAQVASVAPRTVAPSGPTGGSVAQNATLDNAINLRDVNLIGIYGGSNDRRALVRLANGRYVRVTVGDRLDGGRVTGISAGALNYTKRGRAVTLEVAG